MNINQLYKSAELLLESSKVYVTAVPEHEVEAYVNQNAVVSFIVHYNQQWWGLIEDQDEGYSFKGVKIEDFDLKGYTPLTTVIIKSYPNFENLVHFGDQELKQWVRSQEVNPDNLFDIQGISNSKYIDFWMNQHPMYNPKGIYAYQKGWAMIWPEDDTPMQWDENLEFTFQIGLEQEPVVEVFWDKKGKEFFCVERNT